MESLHIIKFGKDGGSVTNVVDETMFTNVYEPAGWVIDKDFKKEIEEETKEIKTEQDIEEVKNIEATKKVTPKKFNDKLIKGK